MPFNGDFIKRHAEAVSLQNEVCVIHVVRDVNGVVTKDVKFEKSARDGLVEIIIYYYTPSYKISIVDKFLSEIKYRNLYKKAINDYLESTGKPDLVHVHIGMKAGVIALWLKKKMSIPYIISEHWSGFLPESNEKFRDQPVYLRSLWIKVISGSAAISAVSMHLAKAIKKQFGKKEVEVIPNVVDTSVFYPVTSNTNDIRFIHISGLEELKNPHEIIQAFAIVLNKYPEAVLDIFGPENKQLENIVIEKQLEKSIHFYREIPQPELAEYVRKSIALILFSRYETFGCVIIEANACGVPVIVSNIPVFHETVTEGVNGIFVKTFDPIDLAEKMIEMIKTRTAFDSATIVNTISKYRYEMVANQFSELYDNVLSKKN